MSSVCRTTTIALTGLTGTEVTVEAAVTRQLPGMAIIGLPDVALAEAKLRVKVACTGAGYPLYDRFITVNLSPAALPKHGSSFDLAIAIAALAALGKIPRHSTHNTLYLGELGLDGTLRRPQGLLSLVHQAKLLGHDTIMVPEAAAAEALLVPGIQIIAAATLHDAIHWHIRRDTQHDRIASSDTGPRFMRAPQHSSATLPQTDHIQQAPEENSHTPDLSDIFGQPEAVEALTIAAAGQHNLSMIGPPGAGKTMLAARLPTILPKLTPEQAIESSCIFSLGGNPVDALITDPPFEAPHHTASTTAIVGGGGKNFVHIGAVTRANHGVLLLDEAPEFARTALDALRQPLESGSIEILRANLRVTLPAQIQLVLTANPCPCGNAGSVETVSRCTCTPTRQRNYLARLSGPLKDRIDIQLQVRRATTVFSNSHAPDSTTTRHRVEQARDAARQRLIKTPWNVNARVSGKFLRTTALKLPTSRTAVLDRAYERGNITLRGYDRILRVAWTVADLNGHDSPTRDDIATAIKLRQGETT